ncbi:MAG: DUF885 domain-containing protein [Gammaproteobacteria bacterium]
MRIAIALILCATPALLLAVEAPKQPPAWIAVSNGYTNTLLDVQLNHSPETGSRQGIAKFDALITKPSLTDEKIERQELEAALAKLKTARAKETDKKVLQDLDILRTAFELQFRTQDYDWKHEVPYLNASSIIFGGLRGLLDDQVSAARWPAALARLNKYAGVENGYQPFTELLQQYTSDQMAKPGVVFPSKAEIETQLGRNSNYLSGISDLFIQHQLTGWQTAFQKLKGQLTAYDQWVRTNLLPRARIDFRLAPEKYALAFEGYGIDIPPAQVAAMAHIAFTQYQAEMAPLAAQVAIANHYASSDYRSVISELKKQQITGEAILPFFEKRLKEIERIVATNNLVTLPDRPAIIRLATPAETAQQPAPHMVPPAFLHNTGQRGAFVLPLNIPSATGGAADKYDDFTYDAVAWTLTAHEARPGHELQFDSMVEQGVSLARSMFAFNSTNAEGWGLYAEYIMQPFEPAEGQLLTLQLRLLRAARAILDPELQSGKVTTQQAYDMLEKDVMLSHAFAKEEVERFTFEAPGQANSYFYGYTRILSLRKETEAALGKQFDQKKFHDFLLGQGLLPPNLMRNAVLEDFIPNGLSGAHRGN